MRGRLLRAGASGWTSGLQFPNASNTGPAVTPTAVAGDGTGGTLSDPSSNPALYGSGWVYSASSGAHLQVTGTNSVVSNLIIPFPLNLLATPGCLIKNCIITAGPSGAGTAVQLRHTTGGVTIQDSIVSGYDSGANRMSYGISSVFGDDPNVLIQRCNIFWMRIGINTPATATGTVVRDNYIHDAGFAAGDHTECVTTGQGPVGWLFDHNTFLIQLTQTSALPIGTGSGPTVGVTVTNNLIAGGGYGMYGSSTSGDTPSNIVVANNWFSVMFFPNCGQFGPLTAWFDGGTAPVAVSAASPAVFTYTLTGQPNATAQVAVNQPLTLTATTMPAGFTAQPTVYYVVNPSAVTGTSATQTFNLSLSAGGSLVGATTTGTAVTFHGAGTSWTGNTWLDGIDAGTNIPS